ncbi:related to C2H2 transcription factor [Cephalotrichum gorgonifer]|uniref:Related to C2H2 transcription factor n=1 Tax=Cephalotrichum gorgonifer TaxID=2041049 RepID=A0AAE8SZW2_9PEZI|nr:related to C2H2 transcription factor [Cephalotrichum gorgonifer]
MAKVTKTHRCNRCSRDFARLEHLQRHERSHTKEKPFQCIACTKAFTRKDLLTRHDRIAHHPPVNDAEQNRPRRLSSQSATVLTGGMPSPETLTTPPGDPVQASQGDTTILVRNDDGAFSGQDAGLSLEELPDDFTLFMDSVPPPNHVFSPTLQPLPTFYPNITLPWAVGYPEREREIGWPSELPIQASTVDSSSALSTYGSRLPSLQPETGPPSLQNPSTDLDYGAKHHMVVSVQGRNRIIDELSRFSNCVPKDFVLPSRHGLSRFVAAYFNTFHEHYPVLHVPTLRMDSISVELFTAIAAVGARYSREPEVGIQLFYLAKAVVLERLGRRQATTPPESNADSTDDGVTCPTEDRYTTVETMQTLLLLIAISTWFKRQPGVYEALSIRSILDSLVREDGFNQQRELQPRSWTEWIKYESLKRIKLVVFCFFNIHTIVFDMPPMIVSSELNIDLPCSENEWKASSETLWQESRGLSLPPEGLQAASERLFVADDDEASRPRSPSGFSSLGGYVLIHTVIQRIWLVRNAVLPSLQGQRFSVEMMHSFEQVLKTWSSSWECNRESSMDPLSPYGPLSFTSTALLRLAYIRINLDLGPIRSLGTWDPGLIAKSLDESPPARRSHRLTRAALHCAHALSIPVKLGINFVAQTQVVYWSNQHALCSLECAVLLAKWLEAVTVLNPSPPLNAAEERVLDFVAQLVAESCHGTRADKLLQRKTVLSSKVVRLWAALYKSESVWEMVDLIGRSLDAFAGLLEDRHTIPPGH